MDKTEYKIRLDQIKSLISEHAYEEAMEVCDTIDWKRIKSTSTLCMVSEIYKVNRKYVDARDVLLMAYDRNPNGKQIVYSLCELSLKLGDLVEAVNYKNEFLQIAPGDNSRYVLEYKIYEAHHVGIEERIALLEEYINVDYREKWAFKLAQLYHENGYNTKCAEQCDKLILWFGEGKYVQKALELKMEVATLTEAQQEKYNQMLYEAEIDEYMDGGAQGYTGDVYAGEGYGETGDVYAGEGYGETGDVYAGEEYGETGDVYAGEEYGETGDVYAGEEYGETGDISVEGYTEDISNIFGGNEEAAAEEAVNVAVDSEPAAEEKTEFVPVPDENGILPTADEDAIEVKQLSMDKYSTINIQEELSKDVRKFFEGQKEPESKGVQLKPVEITTSSGQVGRSKAASDDEKKAKVQAKKAVDEGANVRTFKPESKINRVLSQDGDGQISLVMPDQPVEDKQITGQISLDGYLAEWERERKESQRRRIAGAVIKSMEQTNDIASQLEGRLPNITGPLPTVDELAKDIKVPGDAGYVPTGELPAIDDDLLNASNAEPVYTEELPEQEYVAEEYTEEYTEQEYPEEYTEQGYEEEYPAEEYPEEYPAEDEERFNTAGIPMDDFTTSQLPALEEESVGDEIADSETIDGPEDVEEDMAPGSYTEQLFSQEIGEEYSRVLAEQDSVSADNAEIPDEDPEDDVPETTFYGDAEVMVAEADLDEFFGPLLNVKGLKDNLIEAFEQISMQPLFGNVIVTGNEKSSRLKVALAIAKCVQRGHVDFTGKLAKVPADALNTKDIRKAMAAMNNGALIIEGAGNLNINTIDTLAKVINHSNVRILIILEDDVKNIRKLKQLRGYIEKMFDVSVNVPAYSNDDLVEHAKEYAKKNEYVIDEMGVLALYSRIDELQTSDHFVTVTEVEEIMDAAMKNAEKFSFAHIRDAFIAKRYDEDDMLIIKEKDFIAK